MTKIFRQGDVLLMQIAVPAEGAIAPAPKDARGIVLAEGESSGHFHGVFGRGAKLYRFRDTTNAARVLVVGRAGADVRVVGGGVGGVPRHTPIRLEGGAYEIRIQRSWSAQDERAANVQD